MGAVGETLPYDAQVEYLESDGSQYINTGLLPTRGYVFDCNVGIVEDAGTYFFGTMKGDYITTNNDKCVLVYKCGYSSDSYIMFVVTTIRVDSANMVTNVTPSVGEMYNLTDITKDNNAFTDTEYPLILFGYNKKGSIIPSKVKMGTFKATYNGTVLMDMIAVRVGQVGYMYDRISGQLFGNDGTGSFTIGADV